MQSSWITPHDELIPIGDLSSLTGAHMGNKCDELCIPIVDQREKAW